MNKSKNKPSLKEKETRKVDHYFAELDEYFTNGNKGLYALFLILAFFGTMGLIWMIPFPQFQFLIDLKMHTFLNWGSFFIAVVIYSYLKLAPTLSYAALFTISIMSYFIVQLEYVEKDGGPSVILVCSIIAILGFLGLVMLAKKEPRVHGKEFTRFLTIGPIWLWSKVFKKFNIKY